MSATDSQTSTMSGLGPGCLCSVGSQECSGVVLTSNETVNDTLAPNISALLGVEARQCTNDAGELNIDLSGSGADAAARYLVDLVATRRCATPSVAQPWQGGSQVCPSQDWGVISAAIRGDPTATNIVLIPSPNPSAAPSTSRPTASPSPVPLRSTRSPTADTSDDSSISVGVIIVIVLLVVCGVVLCLALLIAQNKKQKDKNRQFNDTANEKLARAYTMPQSPESPNSMTGGTTSPSPAPNFPTPSPVQPILETGKRDSIERAGVAQTYTSDPRQGSVGSSRVRRMHSRASGRQPIVYTYGDSRDLLSGNGHDMPTYSRPQRRPHPLASSSA